jgi:hypothetical protein
LAAIVASLRRREWVILLVAALIAFLLGVIGFIHEKDGLHSFGPTTAVYHALALFRGRFPSSYFEHDPPLYLDVARFLAPAATWLVVVEGLLALFKTQREQARIRRSRDHVVICGLGRRGANLVEELTGKGERVVVVESDAANAGIPACRLRGGLVVTGDATQTAILEQAGAGRARVVVAVCPDDETNLEIASSAARVGDGARTPKLLVHISDDEVRRVLNEAAIAEGPTPPGVECFSVVERGMEAVFRRQLLNSAAPPGSHALVVGLGRYGSALLVAAARLSGVLHPGRILRFTAADENATERLDHLRIRHPQLRRHQIEAMDVEPRSLAFDEQRFLDKAELSVAFVCLEDHAEALSVALALRRQQPIPIVIPVFSESNSAARFLAAGQGEANYGLEVFGLVERACSLESLLQPRTETLARALHEDYVRQQRQAGATPAVKPYLCPWEELPEQVQDDNRAQADDMATKLEAIGCVTRPLGDWGDPLVEFGDDELEEMARLEHDRWMAARQKAGWQRGARNDAARRHPDMLPWAELSDQVQEIDRAFVRALPQMLARSGFGVYRLSRSLGASAGGSPAAAVPGSFPERARPIAGP